MACAQTGSGKTAGFLFPMISGLLRKGPVQVEPPKTSRRSSYPSALILEPTTELVSQIYDEANKFCYATGLRTVAVYGGTQRDVQRAEISRGVDVLVATPGSLIDFIDSGCISLEAIQFLVIGDADRMLDMGFEPQIRSIVDNLGMPKGRQTFMFSATFPPQIQMMAKDFMGDYIFTAVGRVGSANKDVSQSINWVDEHDKLETLIQYLNVEMKKLKGGLVLVFVETKRSADSLELKLGQQGVFASSIYGDKSQNEREMALQEFKAGRTPILVATDAVLRGLEFPNVMLIVNYDLPMNIEDYVHRTVQCGNAGHVHSFFCDKNDNIGKGLAEMFLENNQDVPDWMEKRYLTRGGRFGGSMQRGSDELTSPGHWTCSRCNEIMR